jgi:hypothetical protein
LLDNKVQILAPKELSKMTDAMWHLKYHNNPRPEVVLTDSNGEINLLIDVTQQPVAPYEIGKYKDFEVSDLKQKRKDVKILGEGIKKINGRTVGFIKFSSQASDQKVFNFFFFISVNGKIIFFSFNCIEKLQETWEKVADEILDSIKIK